MNPIKKKIIRLYNRFFDFSTPITWALKFLAVWFFLGNGVATMMSDSLSSLDKLFEAFLLSTIMIVLTVIPFYSTEQLPEKAIADAEKFLGKHPGAKKGLEPLIREAKEIDDATRLSKAIENLEERHLLKKGIELRLKNAKDFLEKLKNPNLTEAEQEIMDLELQLKAT